MPAHRRARWALLVVLVLLVVHGSLYPWHFAQPFALRPAMGAVLGSGRLWTGFGDVLGNVALFMPLGALAWPLLSGGPQRRAAWLLWPIGFAFAWSLQLLQVFVPERDPAWSDAVWNLVGLGLGVAGARAVSRAARSLAGAAPVDTPAPLLLALLWLVIEWWPFLPTLDVQHLRDALRPLLIEPHWSLRDGLDALLGFGAIVLLMQRWPRHLAMLGGLAAASVLGKLFIWGQAVSASHLLGLLAALALGALTAPPRRALLDTPRGRVSDTTRRRVWDTPRARVSDVTRARLCIGAALLWFSADALRPYAFGVLGRSFNWWPFVALLHGSMLSNLLALCWNALWLGIVMVAADTLGRRLGAWAIGLALWVLALEALQTRLAGRVPDITPALLPLLWWLALRALPGRPARSVPA